MPKTALRAALGLFVIATAAACGTHPATATAPASAAAAAAATHSAAAAPLSCKQQYHAWRYSAAGKKLKADLRAAESAGDTVDIPVMLAALKTAGADAAAMDPAPACADPHGYWKQILARIKAAGDNAGAASGLSGLILAEAPLKDVPGLEKKLSAELKRTT